MSSRFTGTQRTATESAESRRPTARVASAGAGTVLARRAGPHSPEEADERYEEARDAWTKAMRAAATGRSSDLAALAIAQEAYETAIVERDRWRSSRRVPIPVEPEASRSQIDAVVGQEIAWRQVHQRDERPAGRGVLGRLFRGRGR